MSDFAGQEYEFAVGSLQGLRAWDVDALGRLHGVTHREAWRPGENVSVCKARREIPCPNPVAPLDRLPKLSEAAVESRPKRKRRRGGHVSPYLSSPEPLADWERELLYGTTRPRCGEPTCRNGKHTVGTGHRFDPECACGFWAYDEASFTPQGEIVGVIDAYGKTTIGTKGFRAEKAKIIALCKKDRDGKALSRSMVYRLASLYPDVAFYDDLDQMIDAHDGVLKDWPEVDDAFWLKPVPQEQESALSLRWATRYSVPSSYFSLGGGL